MEKQKTAQIPKRLEFVVAEPDKDTRCLYSFYLESLGVSEDRVFLAQSGKECLEIFKDKNKEEKKNREEELLLPPTNDSILVILDMHLKDIPSLHVAKEITRINPQQKMIVTTTTSQLEDFKNKANDLGPINAIKEDKILIKPFRFSQLLSLIRTMTINPNYGHFARQ